MLPSNCLLGKRKCNEHIAVCNVHIAVCNVVFFLHCSFQCRHCSLLNCPMICGHICCNMESRARLTALSRRPGNSENSWSMYDLWSIVFYVSETQNRRVKQRAYGTPMGTASANKTETPRKYQAELDGPCSWVSQTNQYRTMCSTRPESTTWDKKWWYEIVHGHRGESPNLAGELEEDAEPDERTIKE